MFYYIKIVEIFVSYHDSICLGQLDLAYSPKILYYLTLWRQMVGWWDPFLTVFVCYVDFNYCYEPIWILLDKLIFENDIYFLPIFLCQHDWTWLLLKVWSYLARISIWCTLWYYLATWLFMGSLLVVSINRMDIRPLASHLLGPSVYSRMGYLGNPLRHWTSISPRW